LVISCNQRENRLIIEYCNSFDQNNIRAKNPKTTQIVSLWDLMTYNQCPKDHRFACDACSVKKINKRMIDCRLGNSIYKVAIKPDAYNPDDLQGERGTCISGTVSIGKGDKLLLKDKSLGGIGSFPPNFDVATVSTIEILAGEETAHITEISDYSRCNLSKSSSWTFAPSFDCTKQLNTVEKMICTDGELAEEDVRLSSQYQLALCLFPNKTAMKKEQDTWHQRIRDVCHDRNCILEAYKLRLESLKKNNKEKN
jgi:hypothetical protein